MALPDLDTTDISWIGYWNFLDNGGTSIDPMEAASALDSYQEYTNGIQGIYTLGDYYYKSREYGARVKDDGWFVVWMDRTEQTGTRTNHQDLTGPWDVFMDWTDGRSEQGFPETGPSHAIQNIKGHLSNSAEATFNHGDVGIYDYANEDATTVTWFSQHVSSPSVGERTASGSYTPSSGTTLHDGWATGTGYGNDGLREVFWEPNDENVQLSSGTNGGTRDVVNLGETTPGEKSEMHVNTDEYVDEGVGNVMLLWS